MSTTLLRRPLPRRVVAVMIAALFGITLGLNPIAPPKAEANINRHTGYRIVKLVQRQVGVPYVWGGTSPRGFDCSGLSQYVARQAGRRLPRTAHQQYKATLRVRWKWVRPGDLVFFYRNGYVYHMGIYAGNGYMYHAPRAGKRVQRVHIWTHKIIFGRIR